MSMTNEQLLEFKSIQNYLNGAIGSKKSKISDSMTLKEKLKEVNTSQYLRGIALYFEYSEMFNAPNEIIKFFEVNRANTEKMNELKREVQNFIPYLKTKDYGDSTIVAYQSHIRGFLKHNDIKFTFKNYKPKTQKKKKQRQIGFFYEEQLEFAKKVKEFITDMDLRLLLEFSHRTGLGFREIANINFGMLRSRINEERDYEKYEPLNMDREKTTIEFWNFISPSLKDYIKGYLKQNSDKKDSDLIFGNDIDKAYDLLEHKYRTAYRKCCEAYFPKLLEVKTKKGNLKRMFTIHSFRSLFISAGIKLRVPEFHINIMVAHEQKEINAESYASISDELLNDYKLIEAELFGIEKTSENATIDQVFEILKDLVQNNGKRKTLHRKYVEGNETDMDTEIKGAILLEQFKHQIKSEIKEELKNELFDELKEKFANLSLREFLKSSL